MSQYVSSQLPLPVFVHFAKTFSFSFFYLEILVREHLAKSPTFYHTTHITMSDNTAEGMSFSIILYCCSTVDCS